MEDDVRTSANVERSRADRQRPASRREATGLAHRSQSSDDLGHRLDPELGFGGDNKVCTCKVTEVDNTENFESTFNMKGVGTCGTGTGLDFACHFSEGWMDGSACP